MSRFLGIVWRATRSGAVVVAALLAAEAFLQLTQSRTLEMGFWFTPGIHVPDERFGYRYVPDFHGSMRHPDQVFDVPLTLDHSGYRNPVVTSGPGPVVDVVFLGGLSMMFGFGLRDEETVPGQLAAFSRHRIRAVNTAWPGFPLYSDYQLYREKLDGGPAPALAILVIYERDGMERVPADFEPLELTGQELFRFRDDIALDPKGRAAAWLGPWYYRSFLVHKGARLLDTVLPENRPKSRRRRGSAPTGASKTIPRVAYASFLEHLRATFRERGSDVLLAFLPVAGKGARFYEPRYAGIPSGIPFVDLHQQLHRNGIPIRTIADNHYSQETSREIGRLLARQVDPILARRGPGPAGATE